MPVILFTRNGGQWLSRMIAAGVDAVGLDHGISLAAARSEAAGRVALQGNLDPAILATTPDEIRAGVAHVLAEYGQGPGHVFNLGHGITPDIPLSMWRFWWKPFMK